MNKIYLKRIGSFLIDISIIETVSSLIANFIPIKIKVSSFELLGKNFYINISFIIILYILYFILFDILNNGKTLGKILFKIKVLSIENNNLSKVKLVIRSFYKILSILILPISIILYYFYNYFTIQDRICKTKTVME